MTTAHDQVRVDDELERNVCGISHDHSPVLVALVDLEASSVTVARRYERLWSKLYFQNHQLIERFKRYNGFWDGDLGRDL